jgi:hypothetical protein
MTPSALSNETTELDQDALEAAIRALLPEGWASAWGTESHDWMRARGYAITAISAYRAALYTSTERGETIEGWQPIETAPLDGKHCILAIPEPGGFIYSVQGAYQGGQWNAVHRDDVKPLAWMPNVLLPDHLRQPEPPRALNPIGSVER